MQGKIPAILVYFEQLGDRYAILRVRPKAGTWSHRPGQYTEITFAETPRRVAKIYSIASAMNDAGTLEFCIQWNDPALLTEAPRWKVGTTSFDLTPAAGHFFIPPYEKPVVLLAGGSGVTPLKAILEDRAARLRQDPAGAKTTLLYGCGDDDEVPFYEELQSLDRSAKIEIKIFAENIVKGGRDITKGRPLDDLTPWIEAEGEAEFLMCGPSPFMEAARRVLSGAGIAKERIHQDRY